MNSVRKQKEEYFQLSQSDTEKDLKEIKRNQFNYIPNIPMLDSQSPHSSTMEYNAKLAAEKAIKRRIQDKNKSNYQYMAIRQSYLEELAAYHKDKQNTQSLLGGIQHEIKCQKNNHENQIQAISITNTYNRLKYLEIQCDMFASTDTESNQIWTYNQNDTAQTIYGVGNVARCDNSNVNIYRSKSNNNNQNNNNITTNINSNNKNISNNNNTNIRGNKNRKSKKENNSQDKDINRRDKEKREVKSRHHRGDTNNDGNDNDYADINQNNAENTNHNSKTNRNNGNKNKKSKNDESDDISGKNKSQNSSSPNLKRDDNDSYDKIDGLHTNKLDATQDTPINDNTNNDTIYSFDDEIIKSQDNSMSDVKQVQDVESEPILKKDCDSVHQQDKPLQDEPKNDCEDRISHTDSGSNHQMNSQENGQSAQVLKEDPANKFYQSRSQGETSNNSVNQDKQAKSMGPSIKSESPSKNNISNDDMPNDLNNSFNISPSAIPTDDNIGSDSVKRDINVSNDKTIEMSNSNVESVLNISDNNSTLPRATKLQNDEDSAKLDGANSLLPTNINPDSNGNDDTQSLKQYKLITLKYDGCTVTLPDPFVHGPCKKEPVVIKTDSFNEFTYYSQGPLIPYDQKISEQTYSEYYEHHHHVPYFPEDKYKEDKEKLEQMKILSSDLHNVVDKCKEKQVHLYNRQIELVGKVNNYLQQLIYERELNRTIERILSNRQTKADNDEDENAMNDSDQEPKRSKRTYRRNDTQPNKRRKKTSRYEHDPDAFIEDDHKPYKKRRK